MDKEQILLMSRNENHDEGLKNAEDNGRKLAGITFTLLYVIILLLNFFHGKDIESLFVIWFALLAAKSFPKFIFTKKRTDLLFCILNVIAALIWFTLLWRSYGR